MAAGVVNENAQAFSKKALLIKAFLENGHKKIVGGRQPCGYNNRLPTGGLLSDQLRRLAVNDGMISLSMPKKKSLARFGQAREV